MKKVLGLLLVLFLVPLTISAQDFCEGNFDYDDDQDGTDAFTFKTDFGRSSFGDPCPPDGPAPVPKTGQTSCYDADGSPRDCEGTGEDGEYQNGVAWPNPRFTDNLNGTITDNLTGLIWLKNANCFGTETWDQALSDCNGLANDQCELTDGSNPGDWRLPNRFELESLLDMENYNPALPTGHPFTSVMSYYWSNTTIKEVLTDFAWNVDMYLGTVETYSKSNPLYVLCVRGGH